MALSCVLVRGRLSADNLARALRSSMPGSSRPRAGYLATKSGWVCCVAAKPDRLCQLRTLTRVVPARRRVLTSLSGFAVSTRYY